MYSYEITLLIVHAAIVGFCLWHLTTRTRYSEARLNFVLPLILFVPGAGLLYLLAARAGTVPPDSTKTGSSSRHFEHRLGSVTVNAPNGVCRAVKVTQTVS